VSVSAPAPAPTSPVPPGSSGSPGSPGSSSGRRAAAPPRASLTIPTRNRCAALERTLASLTSQTEPAFEVIVVDDGSDDDTPAVARRFAGRLDLRYLRKAHQGVAAARSSAMRAARGDILIQTDDDRIASPSFVADHLAGHAAAPGPTMLAGQQRGILTEWSSTAGLPATAVAQILARNPQLAPAFLEPRAELLSADRLTSDLAGALLAFELPEPWWVGYLEPLASHYGPDLTGFAFPWTMAVGGNSSVPRALAEQIGYLDESFVGWGLEDTDFHFRLCQAGARTRVLPDAVSYHQLHRRGPELGRDWMQNARRIAHKHASVELCLYLAAVRRRTPMIAASDAANAIVAASPPAALEELIRAHREALGAVA
jgi:glycosyltransferase involved in cell wall biosynthesis